MGTATRKTCRCRWGCLGLGDCTIGSVVAAVIIVIITFVDAGVSGGIVRGITGIYTAGVCVGSVVVCVCG